MDMLEVENMICISDPLYYKFTKWNVNEYDRLLNVNLHSLI